MTRAPSIRDMPSTDGDVPPLCLYDDTWMSICIEYLERAHPWLDRLTVASWYDGQIPGKFDDYLSAEPHSGGGGSSGSTSSKLKRSFEDLSDMRQQLFIDAEEKWNFGPNSGTFKVSDLVEETTATDTKTTVRKAVKDWVDRGLATQVGNKSRNKEFRLVESRFANPDARADGGGEADIVDDWDERIRKLEERHLWDYAEGKFQEKFDPVDWFAQPNEDDIISLFRDFSELDDLVSQCKSLREDYEEDLDDDLEGYVTFTEDERVSQLKEIREVLKDIRDVFTDIWMRFSDLVTKGFRSAVNWWMAISSDGFDLAQQHHPTNKRDTITTRIDSKR